MLHPVVAATVENLTVILVVQVVAVAAVAGKLALAVLEQQVKAKQAVQALVHTTLEVAVAPVLLAALVALVLAGLEQQQVLQAVQ